VASSVSKSPSAGVSPAIKEINMLYYVGRSRGGLPPHPISLENFAKIW
jgi:hypothetical protein